MYDYGEEVLPKIAICTGDFTYEVNASVNRVLNREREFLYFSKGDKLKVISKEGIDYIWRNIIVKDDYFICELNSPFCEEMFDIQDIE